MRLALDTNVFVYAERFEGTPADGIKIDAATRLVRALPAVGRKPVAALQSFAELHRVLVRKRALTPRAAAAVVGMWQQFCDVVATDQPIFQAALELAADHQLQIYDCVIFAAAVHGRADVLLSEDMQHGFTWRGVTVLNPFAPEPDPRIAALLR